MGELPSPRPPPPRAVRWWGAAVVCAIASIVMGVHVLTPQGPPPATPIEVQFKRAEDGWNIRFDADDLAVVDIIALGTSGLELLHPSVSAGKGQWATGEGDYYLSVPHETVALISSPQGIPEIEQLVVQARAQPVPMQAIEGWIREVHPTVDFVVSPEIVVSQEGGVVVDPGPSSP